MPPSNIILLRNVIFGVEDSLVSTLGFLTGISVTRLLQEEIIMSGIILVLVEAFSMSVGSFLSEESVEEFQAHRRVSSRAPLIGSIAMFFSYAVAGFIPIMPFLLIERSWAIVVSVFLSLGSLFLLGVVRGAVSSLHLVRSGIHMLMIGGFAAGIGMIIGYLFSV